MEVRATDSAQKRQTFPSEAMGRAVPEAPPDTAQGQGDAQFSGIVSSDNANRDSLVLIVEQFAFAKETLQLGGGRICRVGSMADVDHHIHAEITANGAFVSLLGICRTKQVANVRNGVFTLQRECNHRSLLHEILDLWKERLFRDMRVMFPQECVSELEHFQAANFESGALEALQDLSDELFANCIGFE